MIKADRKNKSFSNSLLSHLLWGRGGPDGGPGRVTQLLPGLSFLYKMRGGASVLWATQSYSNETRSVTILTGWVVPGSSLSPYNGRGHHWDTNARRKILKRKQHFQRLYVSQRLQTSHTFTHLGFGEGAGAGYGASAVPALANFIPGLQSPKLEVQPSSGPDEEKHSLIQRRDPLNPAPS